MTDLPSSFSANPDQNPHKYFKNLLIDFKKEVKGAVDKDALETKMQSIINASKEMSYQDTHKKGIYHKPEAQKALTKLFNEFDRYIKTIENDPTNANAQDLIDSISIVENLLSENDIY